MNIFDTALPAVIRPVRGIDGIHATVTIEESGQDDLEITRHPIQRGAKITDHAIIVPTVLRVRAAWDDQERPLDEIYESLLLLQGLREPIEVVTGKRIYTDMLIASIATTTDAQTENTLAVSMVFEQVIIVETEVVSVPPRERQSKPGKTGGTENAGAKKAQPTSRSALDILARGG